MFPVEFRSLAAVIGVFRAGSALKNLERSAGIRRDGMRKASAPRPHVSNRAKPRGGSTRTKNPPALHRHRRVRIQSISPEASPVASALGIRSGATPRGRLMSYHFIATPRRWRRATPIRPPVAPCAPPPTAALSSPACSLCAEFPWWPDKALAAQCRQTTAALPRRP